MSASTCSELLEYCLKGRDYPPALLHRCLAEHEGKALLRDVVEKLGDLFDPALCDAYARLMRDAIAETAPYLLPRVRRARRDARWPAHASRIYVLSRITLGADVAVTSVLMDAAKRRYPDARIVLVGPHKNFELFQADPRLEHQDAPYARNGGLLERLRASAALWFDDGLVIDPDSRLSQLGMLRVCEDDRYLFFESRSACGAERLPDLAALWAGDARARPYIAPAPVSDEPAAITVSLGVGENMSKRLDDAFEVDLMRTLAATGQSILADLGGTTEERSRVERSLQPGMRTHDGSFAAFAAQIAKSQLFVGYDSAAGHVASACGVPVISIAAGFASKRMAARWRPVGSVIPGDSPGPIDAVRAALATCTFRR